MTKHLAALGLGFTARALARRLHPTGWRITGSTRTEEGATAIRGEGYNALLLDSDTTPDMLANALGSATHILVSASPGEDGDPVIRRVEQIRGELPHLAWIGYLSTIGVYGGHDGAWIDEDTAPNPTNKRGKRRVVAEQAWLDFGARCSIAVQVFRLPGIYGPGRSVFDRLRAGTSRRIIKPGQVFNRMHVDDIAGALEAAMNAATHDTRLFNLTDGNPAPPQDVIVYAAELMGIEPPPEVAFEAAEMTAMARSFYGDNKRVSNARMMRELGYQPIYPTFEQGLAAIWQVENTERN